MRYTLEKKSGCGPEPMGYFLAFREENTAKTVIVDLREGSISLPRIQAHLSKT